MRKFLLTVLMFIGTFLISYTDLFGQNVEVQVQTNSGMMSSSGGCNACANTTPTIYTRLRVVYNGTSAESGYNVGGAGCGTYYNGGAGGTNPITTAAAAYNTSATIQLYADDQRACEIQTVNWNNSTGGTTTFNPNAQAPGENFSAEQTSTLAEGTTTTGTKWQYRWRYTTAGSPGTLTVSGGTNYCSTSLPGTLTIDGSTPTGRDLQYEWRYSFNGYSTVLATTEDYSSPFPSSGYTYRRIVKWRNNYVNASPTFITAQTDVTINISSAPSGTVASPVNACSGGTVVTSITGWNAGSGTPTIIVKDPLSNEVYNSVSPSINFSAPAVLGVPNSLISYSVTATPAAPCSIVNLGTLNVNYYESSKAPSSIDITPSATICKGTSVTLTARGARLGYGGSRYEWATSNSFGTIISSSTTDSTYTTPAINTGVTYYVRIGNNTSPGAICAINTGSVSQVITVVDPTIAPTSVTSTSPFYCQGSPTAITLAQVGGTLGSGANWQWSIDPTFTTVLTGQTSPSINVLPGTGPFPAATTTYYVRGENNTAPCGAASASASYTITYKSSSVVADSVTSSTNGVCAGTSIDLTVNGGSLGSGAQWYWYANSCGGTPIDSGSTITVTPSTSTTYYLRAEGSCDTTNCVSKYVFIFEPAVDPDSISIDNDGVICADLSTNVTLTVVGGQLGTGMEWYWFDDPSFTSYVTSGNPIVVDVTGSSKEFWAIAISDGSEGAIPAPCPDSTTAVHINLSGIILETAATMDAISVDNNLLCDEGNVEITATGTAESYDTDANPLGFSTHAYFKLYNQDPTVNPASLIDSNQTGIFNVNVNTTTTYYVLVENSCGQTAPLDVTVTVNYSSLAPTVVTQSLDSICNGDATNVTLTADGTLGTDAVYEWSEDGFANVLSSGLDPFINVSPTTTTTYSVRINNTATPCVDVSDTVQTVTVIVTEPSVAPTALTFSSDSICNGDATNVTVDADGTLGTDALYEWSDDNFATIIPGESTSQITVSPTTTTTYYARIVGPAPCADVSATVASADLIVNDPSVAPTSLTSTNDSICNGAATSVTLTANGGTLGTAAVYEWSEDGFANVLSSGLDAFINVSPTTTTTYSVRITGPAPCADVSGTVQTVTVVVTNPSTAPTAVTFSTDSICNGYATNVTVSVDGALGTDARFEWSEDNFATSRSGDTTNTITVSPTVTTTYYARIVGPAPCSDISTTIVSAVLTVNDSSLAPTVLTLSTDSICNGAATNVTITADGTLNNGVYEWATDAGFTSIVPGTTNTITVSPVATTTYYARIVDNAPCSTVSASANATVIVTEASTAPTAVTFSTDSICNGNATNVIVSVDGVLGTDARFEWSEDNFATSRSGDTTNTITVSPTVTTTYYARIVGPAPCSDISTTIVSAVLTVNESSIAPTVLTLSTDSICNGAATNVTITADGTLNDDGVYEWSVDNFTTTIPGESTNTITVSPTSSTTYYARIVDIAPCSTVSASVNSLLTVVEPSDAPTSITVSNSNPCYGETLTLTQVGGVLNDAAAYYEWSTDPSFTTSTTTTVDTFDVIITEPTTYYVRAVDPCGPTSATSVDVDWVQASNVVYGTGLTTTSEIASQCSIDDNNWHYFVDANGDVVAAINSNGQDLGQVIFGVTVGANGPFVSTSALSCTMGEYYVARKYNFQTANKAISDVSVRLFITSSEYAAHKAIDVAQDAFYKECFGSTSTAADLQVSAFYAFDAGALGEGITSLSYSANGGPGGTHQYQFDFTPQYGGPRYNPNGKNDPAKNTDLYLHNSGGRSSVLPVELTSFTATKVTEGVALNWNTASELNNDRFEVLRSEDGVNFVQIGTVKGSGSSNTPKSYSFIDTEVSSGTYYYQLRQVDYDGTATLSKVVSVELSVDARLSVGNFFPNPAQQSSSVMISSPKNSEVIFTLYSIDGKQTLNKVYQLAKGENRIDIDVNNVATGSYIGIFQTNGQVINRKLIIQE
jgi:hypothetical protein